MVLARRVEMSHRVTAPGRVGPVALDVGQEGAQGGAAPPCESRMLSSRPTEHAVARRSESTPSSSSSSSEARPSAALTPTNRGFTLYTFVIGAETLHESAMRWPSSATATSAPANRRDELWRSLATAL